MSGKKKKKSEQPHKRRERRFFPKSAYSPWIAHVAGGLGAASLGAGTWAYLYGHAFEGDEKLKAVPQYLIAAGAVFSGIAIWFGSSNETPVRIGDPGIGVERGEVRRMPWWAVERIAWDEGTSSLTVRGKDESGADWSFNLPVKSHPEAVAILVSEADRRIPDAVELTEGARASLPVASSHAGMLVDLEPLQVVGKRCASNGKVISYEPDARVCERCERVYLKTSVPKKCACGASLAHLRGNVTDEDEPSTEAGAEA